MTNDIKAKREATIAMLNKWLEDDDPESIKEQDRTLEQIAYLINKPRLKWTEVTNDIIEIAKQAGLHQIGVNMHVWQGDIFQLTKFAELIQARAVPDGYVVVQGEVEKSVAKKIRDAFDVEKWNKYHFVINGTEFAVDGDKSFYKCRIVDAVMSKIQDVVNELEATAQKGSV